MLETASTNPRITQDIISRLLTDDDARGLVDVMRAGLKATKTRRYLDGHEVVASFDDPDWDARGRFADLQLRVRGSFARAQGPARAVVNVVILGADSQVLTSKRAALQANAYCPETPVIPATYTAAPRRKQARTQPVVVEPGAGNARTRVKKSTRAPGGQSSPISADRGTGKMSSTTSGSISDA